MMAECKQCGAELRNITGKVQKQFCSDNHRLAYKRAELKKSEVTGAPPVDKPRTINSKVTSDINLGQGVAGDIDIQTLAEVDTACGDILSHGLKCSTAKGNIRVSKPGDPDYEPQCETTKALIEGKPKITEVLKHIGIRPDKRGKDIKCFEDLPADVQETIHMLSTINGKIDQTIKTNRTAIAIHYQHLFPDRFHSTGAT